MRLKLDCSARRKPEPLTLQPNTNTRRRVNVGLLIRTRGFLWVDSLGLFFATLVCLSSGCSTGLFAGRTTKIDNQLEETQELSKSALGRIAMAEFLVTATQEVQEQGSSLALADTFGLTQTFRHELWKNGLPVASPELVARKMARLKYSVAEMMNWDEARWLPTENGIQSFIVGHYQFSHEGSATEISPGKQRLEPTSISNQRLSIRCFSTESGKLLYRSEHQIRFKYGVSELRPKQLAKDAARILLQRVIDAQRGE